MKAVAGDRLVIRPHHLGEPERDGWVKHLVEEGRAIARPRVRR
jgi:hypothetical protein